MLNPLEINKDFNTKTFFPQGPTRSLFGCRRCNLCRRERNICFIAVRFARLPFQVSDISEFLQQDSFLMQDKLQQFAIILQ